MQLQYLRVLISRTADHQIGRSVRGPGEVVGKEAARLRSTAAEVDNEAIVQARESDLLAWRRACTISEKLRRGRFGGQLLINVFVNGLTEFQEILSPAKSKSLEFCKF